MAAGTQRVPGPARQPHGAGAAAAARRAPADRAAARRRRRGGLCRLAAGRRLGPQHTVGAGGRGWPARTLPHAGGRGRRHRPGRRPGAIAGLRGRAGAQRAAGRPAHHPGPARRLVRPRWPDHQGPHPRHDAGRPGTAPRPMPVGHRRGLRLGLGGVVPGRGPGHHHRAARHARGQHHAQRPTFWPAAGAALHPRHSAPGLAGSAAAAGRVCGRRLRRHPV